MSKSIVTEYREICFFCGRQAEGEHHLIFGTAGRELSEKDGLKVPTCNNCHNMGDKLKIRKVIFVGDAYGKVDKRTMLVM